MRPPWNGNGWKRCAIAYVMSAEVAYPMNVANAAPGAPRCGVSANCRAIATAAAAVELQNSHAVRSARTTPIDATVYAPWATAANASHAAGTAAARYCAGTSTASASGANALTNRPANAAATTYSPNTRANSLGASGSRARANAKGAYASWNADTPIVTIVKNFMATAYTATSSSERVRCSTKRSTPRMMPYANPDGTSGASSRSMRPSTSRLNAGRIVCRMSTSPNAAQRASAISLPYSTPTTPRWRTTTR